MSLIQTHPQYQQVMQMVQNHGGNAQEAFYELAKQKGIDPEQILRMLR